MWGWDHKESWVWKNWCFWTVVLEKRVHERPLDFREIKPVNPKENQSWILIGRTDAETEAPILWPSAAKSRLIGKDPDAGKDQRQEEKRMTEDKMVGWNYQLDGHEFEWALGNGDGQGSLACCRFMGLQSWTRFSDWTTTKGKEIWVTCVQEFFVLFLQSKPEIVVKIKN